MRPRLIKGIAVSPGFAVGPALVVRWEMPAVPDVAIGPQQVRLVTHLDVSETQCRQAAKILRETAGRLAGGHKTAKELEPAY